MKYLAILRHAFQAPVTLVEIFQEGRGKFFTSSQPASDLAHPYQEAHEYVRTSFPTAVIEEVDEFTVDYEQRYDRWANRVLQLTHDRENLYLPDPPEPPAPFKGEWITQPKAVCLQDGRIALRLDEHRALPMCGIQTPVVLTTGEQAGTTFQTGPAQCPACGGFHVTPQVMTPAPPVRASKTLTCVKCNAGEGSLVITPVSIACIICGKVQFFVTGLTEQEVEHNDDVLDRARVIELPDDGHPESVARFLEEETLNPEEEYLNPEEGFLETPDALTETMTSNQETDAAEHTPDPLVTEAEEDDPEAILTRLMIGFWRYRYPLRQDLVEHWLLGQIPDERLALIWSAASALHAEAPRLTDADAAVVADFLLSADNEVLWGLLPIETETDRAFVMPNPATMLWKLVDYIKARAARFRVQTAAARILAKSLGLSEQAVLAAIRMQRKRPQMPPQAKAA